jgi:hypothetical protein
MTAARVRTVLAATWWIAFPSFAALVARFSIGRTCGNADDLLGDLTSSPVRAWLIGSVYVGAHVWMLAAYLTSAATADDLLPGFRVFRAAGRTNLAKLVLMAAVFAVEYAPLTLWRGLGHVIQCRP